MTAPRDLCRERFIQFLLEGKTQEDAYEQAGYKRNAGNAGRLYRSPYVQERIAKAKVEVGEKINITVERILKELAKIGFSDIRQLFDKNGNLRRIEDLDTDTAAFVSSVKVVTRPVAGGERGETEQVTEIKQWDKLSALEKMGKHLGMFAERVEHSGPDGGPIVMEDKELARLIAFSLTKATKEK